MMSLEFRGRNLYNYVSEDVRILSVKKDLLWLSERIKRNVKGENESEKRPHNYTDSAHGIPKFTA
jgi:hypothetical protein